MDLEPSQRNNNIKRSTYRPDTLLEESFQKLGRRLTLTNSLLLVLEFFFQLLNKRDVGCARQS